MALGPDRNTRTERMTRSQAESAQIDVGLRSYMLQVYNYMAGGVALTGIVALVVSMNPALMQAVAIGPFKWVLFIGIVGMGFFSHKILTTASTMTGHAFFWIYAALWGALLAPMFYVYTGESMVRVFFITTAAFAGLSLYGYTTKRNLAPMGAFLAMATIGILVALLVNMFLLQSSGFHLVLSIIVVLVFAAMTAYDTQQIKNMYHSADSQGVTTRKAIFGALKLYGDFVVMFIYLLQIFGVARE